MHRTLSLFLLILLAANSLLAQSEYNNPRLGSAYDYLGSRNLMMSFPGISSSGLLNSEFANQSLLEMDYKKPGFFSTDISKLSTISFRQEKHQDFFYGLGGYEHFNNSITYDFDNKLSLTLSGGLLKYSSVFSPGVNFRYSMGAKLNYQFSPDFGAYVFGQYLGPEMNLQPKILDPYSNQNKQIVNSGIGIKTKLGDSNAKIEFRASFARPTGNPFMGNFGF